MKKMINTFYKNIYKDLDKGKFLRIVVSFTLNTNSAVIGLTWKKNKMGRITSRNVVIHLLCLEVSLMLMKI